MGWPSHPGKYYEILRNEHFCLFYIGKEKLEEKKKLKMKMKMETYFVSLSTPEIVLQFLFNLLSLKVTKHCLMINPSFYYDLKIDTL
jgi:hypothetical protein